MIPSNQWPHTYHDVVKFYHERYEEDIRSGRYKPFLYPWDAIGGFLVIAYLLIPHKNLPWLRHARHLVFAFNLAYTVYMIKNVRAKGVANTLGVGLVAAWGTMWVLAILVCNDAQTDFMRIERMEGVLGSDGRPQEKAQQNGNTKQATEHREHAGPSQRHGEFAWQPYPLTPFVERLDWVLDVFANFRGAAWNWRTISTPPPPKSIQEQLIRNSPVSPKHSFRTSSSQSATFPTRRALILANLKLFFKAYFILDALKTLISHDPYFWGYTERVPAPYLPKFLTSSPIIVHAIRLLICQYAIKYAIQMIFSLSPLFFSGLLGPSLLGARSEPWMYATTYGSYIHVLDGGLAGWWSTWWHQTFRFAFEQPGRKLLQLLNLNPRAPLSRLLQLVIAFSLSGVLHAAGSTTCHGSTRPLLGPMRFFLFQALAVFLEGVFHKSVQGSALASRTPRWVKRGLTFLYVHVWFYHTAHLLCDDFARGGVWLFEPVPFSVFRGVGFGAEGDGWWCVADVGVRWYKGRRWWRTGIAL